MPKLLFKDDKKALDRLTKVQSEIDKFSKKHPGSLNDKEHKELRTLLSKRASALSEATGMKIHSLFD